MENALTSWIAPNNQDGFLSLDLTGFETWILPLANHVPIKLNRLPSLSWCAFPWVVNLRGVAPQVLLEVLPEKLVFRTPYLNFVREIIITIS